MAIGKFLNIAVMLGAFAGQASAQCRQALALGLDVSGSVDAQEYRMQLDGLRAALNDPKVVRALIGSYDHHVRLLVYEWSSADFQRILVPWTQMETQADLAQVSRQLSQTTRQSSGPSTALGSAMSFGLNALTQQSECWGHTLDISGDGISNTGPRPQDVSDQNGPDGAVVNGLTIGVAIQDNLHIPQIGDLNAYYRAYVIRGPSAFVETAIGFEDYQNAMTRKLLRELQSIAIGAGPHPHHPAG
ncbi:DUF1194 domain-containing protein [Aestuariibius sp. HNIBRBA575]|uniref:DUF1194 domain-containing protein n=1 Tax=Aestuariibius sp. HNIBRBA575 TaxID=3233343 RepID=UPI0034A1147F